MNRCCLRSNIRIAQSSKSPQAKPTAVAAIMSSGQFHASGFNLPDLTALAVLELYTKTQTGPAIVPTISHGIRIGQDFRLSFIRLIVTDPIAMICTGRDSHFVAAPRARR
jgi:hypothetical protein